MPGRLVEAHPLRGFFLNQQKFSIALDDGGDGDVRFPDHFSFYQNKKGRVAPAFFKDVPIIWQRLSWLSWPSLLAWLAWLAWLLPSFLQPWQLAWLLPWQEQQRQQEQLRQQQELPWQLQQQRRRKKQRRIQRRSVRITVCSCELQFKLVNKRL